MDTKFIKPEIKRGAKELDEHVRELEVALEESDQALTEDTELKEILKANDNPCFDVHIREAIITPPK